VAAARKAYDLGETPPIAVGYSNGANIAGALLLLHPGALSGALLLRPMVPLVPEPLPVLNGVPVLIVAGRHDPIVPASQPRALADLLGSAGADVTLHGSNAAHALTREDLEAGERWMSAVATHR
jgi:predicted esterase